MSLENGSVTLRRFFVKGRCSPSSNPEWIEQLKENAFVGRELELEDENLGWAVFGEELSTEFSLENTVVGKFIVFSLRRDSIKVPSSLVNLHLKSRIKEKMRSEETESLSKKQRAELKEEVVEQLMEKTPTQIQIVQILLDTAKSEVFVASTSDKVLELFEGLFSKSFDLNLQNADFLSTAHQMVGDELFEKVMDDPGICVGNPIEIHPEFEDSMEGKLGAAFLTWMLFTLQTGDGVCKSKRQGEMGLTLHEYLMLEGEALGSKQMLLKKGVVSRCAELAISLNIGKQVSKLRIMSARDGADTEENPEAEVWTYVLDKIHFDMASLKVPKSEEGADIAKTLARFNYIVDAFELMEDMLEQYLEQRYSNEWSTLQEEMSSWIRGLQSEVKPVDSSP